MSKILTTLEGDFKKVFSPSAHAAASHDIQVILGLLPTVEKYVKALNPVIAAINPLAAAEIAGVTGFIDKYPTLFSATATADQRKLAALGVATDQLKAENPAITTAIARAAVQLFTVPTINAVVAAV
jgi:hypothetical protein